MCMCVVYMCLYMYIYHSLYKQAVNEEICKMCMEAQWDKISTDSKP